MKATKEDGRYPAYAWPGGYPIYYVDAGNNVLCPDCANREDEYADPVTDSDVNYEDEGLYCDDCGAKIESAYGEPGQ